MPVKVTKIKYRPSTDLAWATPEMFGYDPTVGYRGHPLRISSEITDSEDGLTQTKVWVFQDGMDFESPSHNTDFFASREQMSLYENENGFTSEAMIIENI